MNEPIKAGDLAHVIGGMSWMGKGPNVGLVVKVIQLVYECPQLGRIWRCEAEFAERIVRGPGCTCPPGQADFAQSWLRKIEPPPLPGVSTKKAVTA